MKTIKTLTLTVLTLVAWQSWANADENKSFKTNLTGDWSPQSGIWSDSEKGKKGRSPGDGFCFNTQPGTNFTYEGDITLTEGDAAAGALLFRASDKMDAGYCVNIDANGVVKLWALGRGELTNFPTEIKAGASYHLKVVADGSKIKVYFNKGADAVIDYSDENPALTGQFGLNVYNGTAVFQNVNFTATDDAKEKKTFKSNLTGDWSAQSGDWTDSEKGKKGSSPGDGFCFNPT